MARRNRYTPSSSHKLTELIRADRVFGHRRTGAHLTSPNVIRETLEQKRQSVAEYAGVAGADWAIEQLSAAPHIAKGWPVNPFTAAKRRARKGRY